MPDIAELLTYYVITALLMGRMVGYKDHKTYGDSTIYEVNRVT